MLGGRGVSAGAPTPPPTKPRPPAARPPRSARFSGVDTAGARANGGSGVGLALCADIAAAFGAKLEFTSTVGEGTTVALTLPKEVYAHEEADD